jgi:ribosomal-protein-alanine N-acetyltransferase
MQESDLSTVMAIETAAYPFPWTLQNFKDSLQVGYRAKVLELDDHLVGYGLMSIGAGEANILNLCIHPNHQRNSHGRRILKHLLALAKQEEVTTVFLEVRTSNHAAIQLYLQTGFNQVGIRKGYYTEGKNQKEDGLILALELKFYSMSLNKNS